MEDKQIFEMWETFKELLKSTNRPGIDNLIDWLDKTDFKVAPASTHYHNSFKGGLLKHSLDVYYMMYDFNNFIQFFDIPQDTLIITALLHDICKVNCYNVDYRNTKNEEGQWIKVPYYTYNDIEPLGHAEKSIMYIYEHGVEISKIERAMIRNHMGAFKDEPTNVSVLFSKCPQSLILHFADMCSTYITESKDLQSRYKEKLVGRNINECLQILSKPRTLVIDNTEYTLAPRDAEVDGQKIITVNYTENGITRPVKVYAPHGDGLPF